MWTSGENSPSNTNIMRSFGNTPIAPALMPGTGGTSDARYLDARQERGYRFITKLYIKNISDIFVSNINKTSTKDLETIKQMLKPAISDLALLFGVSRQTIYNWQHGEEPSMQNAERILELAKVARFFASKGLEPSPQLLKRKFINKQSLFDIARKGGSIHAASQKLMAILSEEALQRKSLNEHLANRKVPLQSYNDYGSSMLDE